MMCSKHVYHSSLNINMIERTTWPPNEHKKLHSGDAQDIHMSSNNYEANGYEHKFVCKSTHTSLMSRFRVLQKVGAEREKKVCKYHNIHLTSYNDEAHPRRFLVSFCWMIVSIILFLFFGKKKKGLTMRSATQSGHRQPTTNTHVHIKLV